MSEARLLALRETLILQGWRILGEPTDKKPFKFLFQVEGSSVGWTISHPTKGIRVTLSFWLNTHLGNGSKDLSDIQDCRAHRDVDGQELTLYFSKINSETWRRDLKEFVNSLSRIEPKADREN